MTSLVQLSLEPEFTFGHDALAAGRIDNERFFSLLAAELPQDVDGPEARDLAGGRSPNGEPAPAIAAVACDLSQ